MLHSLSHWDHQLFDFIQANFRSGFADLVFLALRDKFCWIPVYVFLISWLIYKYGKSSWKIIALALVTITITDQLNSAVIKEVFQRERPCKEMYFKERFIPVIQCSGGYSFPSTHATNHMALSSLLFFACYQGMKKWKWLLIFWAILVGFSQVYIGVHFPLDVLAGWAEGFIIGFLLFRVLKKYLGWTENPLN